MGDSDSQANVYQADQDLFYPQHVNLNSYILGKVDIDLNFDIEKVRLYSENFHGWRHNFFNYQRVTFIWFKIL